jgi:tetratricopeptide (TPR) repeat protein
MPQPLTADALVYTEYDITDEPLDNRDIKKLPSQVQERIDDLYELAQRDPRQVIPELERLIATYPHVPTFFNYLSIAYLAAGDQEQATALVREAYRRHPQYLFAKVNYANLCLQQGEIGKVPGIFDHACDLQQLYPHRTRFHVSEFTGFAWVMCRYFCTIGERETAALYYHSAVVFCHCWRPCDTLRPSPTPCVKGQMSHAASYRSACSHRDRPRGRFSRSL